MKIVTIILISFFFIFVLVSLIKNVVDYQKKMDFYESFKTKYESEKKRNITLKTTILKESDRNELEKTIRNKLNLIQPGEKLIILPQATPTPFVPTPTPAPNWIQWKNVFFKQE